MAKKLNQISSMPQMKAAFSNWFNTITLIKITSTITDYESINTEESITFSGVIQPLKPSQLILKPYEQRSWNWLQIHCYPDFKLSNGDVIIYNSVRYKVMEFKDYSLNNYVEYHIVQDYE